MTRTESRSMWAPILDDVRKEPGAWFRLEGEHSPSLAHRLRTGKVAGATAGEFEVTTRRTDDPSRRHMWVRYVGSEKEEA